MKNWKTAGPSGIVSEMVKAAEEDSVDMKTDLINRLLERESFLQIGSLVLL